MINRDWHAKNRMPIKPTHEQRMEWHIEHLKNCSCYPVSKKLEEEIREYKNTEYRKSKN